jgi:glycosyltransferase involved in cell wall biosynthesis
MKILMLTPDNQMIDRRILHEAVTLVEAGHEVTLLAGFECKQEETFDYHGVKVHRLVYDWNDTRLINLQRRFWPQHPRLRNLLNKIYLKLANKFFELPPFEHFVFRKAAPYQADVVHVHDLPALRVGAVIARRRGIPLVYDAHEIYYAQEVIPAKTRKRYFKLEKKYIRRAAAAITVNEYIADLMAKRYGIAPPHVIYNATHVPPRKLDKAASPLRKEFPAGAKILLYQGWISNERNLETIIRMMALLPADAYLAVIGYGSYEADLRKIAAELNLGERVKFLGRIENENLLPYTAGADLGIIPYLPIDENHLFCSPNKFFEYVVSGVPIFGHRNPFFEGMKQKYGLIETADLGTPESAAQGLLPLLDPARLAAMRERCDAGAATLNWRVEGEKLLQIYRTLGPAAQPEKVTR